MASTQWTAEMAPAAPSKCPIIDLLAEMATVPAWSPNPRNPPLFLDLPIGANEKTVLGKWAANAPLAFVDQYIGNLRQYRAIAIDVGDQDELRTDAGKLHTLLEGYGEFRDFDWRELQLVEPLRLMRQVHWAGWVAARWHDPAFPRAFAHVGEARWWESHLNDLAEAQALVEAG